MNLPESLKYTKDHEWVRVEGQRAIVGITEYAQSQLGDVVFVDVPEVGKKVSVHGGLSVVESVKAVSDIYAPLSGEVVEVNDTLSDSPELINQDPYGKGWIAVIAVDDPAELDRLLTAADYQGLIGEGA